MHDLYYFGIRYRDGVPDVPENIVNFAKTFGNDTRPSIAGKGDRDPLGRISDRREEHHFAPKAQISFSFAVGKRCCLTANDVMLRINDVATASQTKLFRSGGGIVLPP